MIFLIGFVRQYVIDEISRVIHIGMGVRRRFQPRSVHRISIGNQRAKSHTAHMRVMLRLHGLHALQI